MVNYAGMIMLHLHVGDKEDHIGRPVDHFSPRICVSATIEPIIIRVHIIAVDLLDVNAEGASAHDDEGDRKLREQDGVDLADESRPNDLVAERRSKVIGPRASLLEKDVGGGAAILDVGLVPF